RESLACGTPFVASAVGGVPELAASGAANRVVPAGDAAALANALRHALDHPPSAADVVSPTADWSASTEAVVKIISELRGGTAGGEKMRANRQGAFRSPLTPDVASPGRT